MSTPGTVNFPTSLDDVISLFEVANNASTTLNGAVASGDATITVVSTSLFASTGAFSVDNEIVYYTGKTSTTFTGCVRGRDGTTAASHLTNATVSGLMTARHLAALRDAVIAIETALTVTVGKFTTPSFSAGNFTASSSMTWTVVSGNVITYKYSVVGKMMTLLFRIVSTTVGGTLAQNLKIAIPGSFVAANTCNMTYVLNDNASGFVIGIAATTAGGGVIDLYKSALANWSASTTSTQVDGSLTFEIQ